MNFKQWMAEHGGFNFAQEPELVNGPAYAERGVRSKYKGPGRKNTDPRDQEPNNPDGDKVRKSYGFEKADFLLALGKMMAKKMGKR